jgi:hypothetical protein
MAMIVQAALVQAAEESHGEVNDALSWGVGIGILVVLFALMAALVAFGGGREHS